MKKFLLSITTLVILSGALLAQTKISLIDNRELEAVNVDFSTVKYKMVESVKVVPKPEKTEAKFLKVKNVEFKDGIIEIDISGKPGKGAQGGARGFVGVAFRINDDNSEFECFYLRPTNGRANDQLRRNHSVQYISFPDDPWHKLRKETPGKYESYVDLVPGEWTKVKIQVEGGQAKLYVHGNEQPTLLVNDLKLGTNRNGSIGLWVGPGTEAHFSNLRIAQ
ncbi:MAG: hypothetical protein MI975_24595 [Cytophagales bacterium]|nr:hypothetical protein [Cytophagales bacterium]